MNQSPHLFSCLIASVFVITGCSSEPEDVAYCPPVNTNHSPSHKVDGASEYFKAATPVSLNEFNLKSYEAPIIDGEIHLNDPKRISSRYVLMNLNHGKESLYVIRHAEMDYSRFSGYDYAFLAEHKEHATVVTSGEKVTVVASSGKPNSFNYIEAPIYKEGYEGRVEWKTQEYLYGLATQFDELYIDTAISIDNKPYVLGFAKTKTTTGERVGVVLFDLSDKGSYKYTRVIEYKGEKTLTGNAMYVYQHDNVVMVSVFDKTFKVAHPES
ncbi:hypothetical protein AB4175_10585 [Vibrio cyclitrophicus]